MLVVTRIRTRSFAVSSVHIGNLRQISTNDIFNTLPLGINRRTSSHHLIRSAHTLFGAKFFRSVRLNHRNGILIVAMIRHPSITDVRVRNGGTVSARSLVGNLGRSNLSRNRVFRHTALRNIHGRLRHRCITRNHCSTAISARIITRPHGHITLGIGVGRNAITTVRRVGIINGAMFTSSSLVSLFRLGAAG